MTDALANFTNGRSDMALLMHAALKQFNIPPAIYDLLPLKAIEIIVEVYPPDHPKAGKHVHRDRPRLQAMKLLADLDAGNRDKLKVAIAAYAVGLGRDDHGTAQPTFESERDRLASVYGALRSCGMGDIVDELLVEDRAKGSNPGRNGTNGKPGSNGHGKPLDSA